MLKHKLPYITLLLLFISIIIILGLTQQLKRQQWELWQQREYLQQINIERDLQVREMQEALIALSEDLWEIQAWVNTWTIDEAELSFYAPLDPLAKEGVCFSGDRTITASGAPVVIGETIAAGPDIPFGTQVWIEGWGRREVQDRGGRIGEGQIDIAVGTVEEAMKLGRQTVKVAYRQKGVGE